MGLGDKIVDAITSVIINLMEYFGGKIQPTLNDMVKQEFVGSIITEDRFQTEEVKEIVRELKKKFEHSPDSVAEIGSDIAEGLVGLIAKIQFQAVAKVDVDSDVPHTDAVFIQMAIITDVNLLLVLLGVIVEVFSLGQIDHVADEIRSYLDYSGLTQMTQAGYGIVLGSTLTPLIEKEMMQKTTPSIFDEPASMRLYFKKLINQEQLYDNMQKLGYPNEKTDKMIDANWYYPSPTDFIRFAVREVFRPDIVEQYGYDEAFPIDEPIPPDQLPEWIKENVEPLPATLRDLINIGMLDETTLKWYWRSHWELPSPTMGYEMLHRKVITQDDLETLLKIQDFAPFWIPKMIDISYSPYTRVDARRMYETGVLSDEEYTTALEDLGYPRDKAEKYLEWTKLRKMSPEKDITRTMILNAFDSGLKDRNWAISQLQTLGYDHDEAELIIMLREFDLSESELRDHTDLEEIRFVKGLISEEELQAGLDELGLNELQKAKVIDSASVKKDQLLRLPSKTDFADWFKKDLISETVYRQRMAQLGFLNADIDLYIEEIILAKG